MSSITPGQQPFVAWRNATWNPPLAYSYIGGALPLDGARIDMQLRLYPGASGAPLLSLSQIAWSDELLGGTEGADDELRLLTLDLGGGWSPVQLQSLPGLAAASMAQLAVLAQLPAPTTVEVGGPLQFPCDILITYSDGNTDLLVRGTFILQPGVTRL